MKRVQHQVNSQLCHNAVMTSTNHLTSECSSFHSSKTRVPSKTISNVPLNLILYILYLHSRYCLKLQMNNSNFFFIFSQRLVEFFVLCFLSLQGFFYLLVCLWVGFVCFGFVFTLICLLIIEPQACQQTVSNLS